MQLNNEGYQNFIQELDSYTGHGSGLVTFIVPATYQLERLRSMIAHEISTAKNIKDKKNRLAVMSSLAGAKTVCDLVVKKLPTNGLILCVGSGAGLDVTRAIEPPNPVTKFIYHCGSKFATEYIAGLADAHEVYGYVIVDGNGALFATVSNGHATIAKEIEVSLPNKQAKGGQSSVRFARLRL
jgi:peptide chain release factor subunit 1